jgi:hypothetical protein
MNLLCRALSKIPYIVHRWEMSAETWNNLKTKVMAVHGPNIDWWDVRFKVNRLLVARRDPNATTHPKDTAVEAFNTMYELTPLPYRNNHPDGSPPWSWALLQGWQASSADKISELKPKPSDRLRMGEDSQGTVLDVPRRDYDLDE